MCNDLRHTNPDAPDGQYTSARCRCGRFTLDRALVGCEYRATPRGGFVEYEMVRPGHSIWTARDRDGRHLSGPEPYELVAALCGSTAGFCPEPPGSRCDSGFDGDVVAGPKKRVAGQQMQMGLFQEAAGVAWEVGSATISEHAEGEA